jgi:hypothetical protein
MKIIDKAPVRIPQTLVEHPIEGDESMTLLKMLPPILKQDKISK